MRDAVTSGRLELVIQYVSGEGRRRSELIYTDRCGLRDNSSSSAVMPLRMIDHVDVQYCLHRGNIMSDVGA